MWIGKIAESKSIYFTKLLKAFILNNYIIVIKDTDMDFIKNRKMFNSIKEKVFLILINNTT